MSKFSFYAYRIDEILSHATSSTHVINDLKDLLTAQQSLDDTRDLAAALIGKVATQHTMRPQKGAAA